jgi:hypothetical protein
MGWWSIAYSVMDITENDASRPLNLGRLAFNNVPTAATRQRTEITSPRDVHISQRLVFSSSASGFEAETNDHAFGGVFP